MSTLNSCFSFIEKEKAVVSSVFVRKGGLKKLFFTPAFMGIPGCPPVNVKSFPDDEKGLILRTDDCRFA